MSASGVWFGNKAWPSGSSPGAWARDVFRLENCETDRDKAMAVDKWLLRCMNRGPNLELPSLGGYAKCNDPTVLFTSWAHNECTGWGWIATEALNANGIKTRRAVTNNSGHTFHEVWYRGLDGKEGWHAFDPFIGWYYLNDSGEVASCEELAANPDLVARPRLGGRSRLGHHPERSGVLHRYQVHDNLDVVQHVQGYELTYEPQVGMTYSNLWRPELPYQAYPTKDPSGAHCTITLYDEEGRPRYPEHHPYWKNYVWPTRVGEVLGTIDGGQPTRWHGCGALRWQPLLWGKDVTWRSDNVVFEEGRVRPAGAKKHGEVWWHIKLPYLATYLKLNVAADVGGGDLIGFAVSPDAGKTIRTVYWKSGTPPKIISLLPKAETSLRGMQEFWLRLDMSTQSAGSPLRIRGLQINVGYHLNMHLLPRLMPGENQLYVQADELDGKRLAVDWAYTQGLEEKVSSVALDKGTTASANVNPGIQRPDELIMRGVTLRCLPGE